jgi:hypothetical protein
MLAAQIFNALEAAFWFALAALCIATAHRARGFTPRRQLAMTAFLIAFGVSDLWELASGWSQPAALFAFKAVCLVGLTITAGPIYGTRWRMV